MLILKLRTDLDDVWFSMYVATDDEPKHDSIQKLVMNMAERWREYDEQDFGRLSADNVNQIELPELTKHIVDYIANNAPQGFDSYSQGTFNAGEFISIIEGDTTWLSFPELLEKVIQKEGWTYI